MPRTRHRWRTFYATVEGAWWSFDLSQFMAVLRLGATTGYVPDLNRLGRLLKRQPPKLWMPGNTTVNLMEWSQSEYKEALRELLSGKGITNQHCPYC